MKKKNPKFKLNETSLQNSFCTVMSTGGVFLFFFLLPCLLKTIWQLNISQGFLFFLDISLSYSFSNDWGILRARQSRKPFRIVTCANRVFFWFSQTTSQIV